MRTLEPKISRDGEIFNYYNEADQKRAKAENYVVRDGVFLANSRTYITSGGSITEERRTTVIPVLDVKEYKNKRGFYVAIEMTHIDPKTGHNVGVARLGYPSTDIFWDSSSGVKYPILLLDGDGLPFPAKVGGEVMLIVGDDEGMVSEKASEAFIKLPSHMRKELMAC